MISSAAIESLRAQIRGRVIEPHDAEYDAARRVFNAMIDRYPGVIVRCAGVADVQLASRRAGRDRGPAKRA